MAFANSLLVVIFCLTLNEVVAYSSNQKAEVTTKSPRDVFNELLLVPKLPNANALIFGDWSIIEH